MGNQQSTVSDQNQAVAKGGAKSEAVTLLIIQIDNYDWNEIFGPCPGLDDGRGVRVVQAGWDELLVSADSPAMSGTTRCLVHLPTNAKYPSRPRTIQPDFLLVRNEVRGITPGQDWRNALYGLLFANIPSVNSLHSIYAFLERPIVQSELNRIQRQLGEEEFPVIPQSYFSLHSTMMYGSKFPCVLKVGHAHAGFGKMRIRDHYDWEDVRSVVAVSGGLYCTAEPFIEGSFDVRIQRIGTDNTRAFTRTNVSGTWKTNTGCSIIEEIPVTPKYQRWADRAQKMFGGLDILTVDVIHDSATGKEYILEVNGTSSGLMPERAEEDNRKIRDLVLKRMNQLL